MYTTEQVPGRGPRLMGRLRGSRRIRIQTQIAYSRRVFDSWKSGHESRRGSRKSAHTKILSQSLDIGRESLDIPKLGRESLDISRANVCAASGFRPKLHSRAERLSLKSLNIRSEKSGYESRKSGHSKIWSRKSFKDIIERFLFCGVELTDWYWILKNPISKNQNFTSSVIQKIMKTRCVLTEKPKNSFDEFGAANLEI